MTDIHDDDLDNSAERIIANRLVLATLTRDMPSLVTVKGDVPDSAVSWRNIAYVVAGEFAEHLVDTLGRDEANDHVEIRIARDRVAEGLSRQRRGVHVSWPSDEGDYETVLIPQIEGKP